MRRRWFGLAMAAISVAVAGYGFTRPVTDTHLVIEVVGGLAFLAPALIGGYLVWRLPSNAVGWLLTGFGLSFSVGVTGEAVAVTGQPIGTWWGWLGPLTVPVGLVLLLVFFPLLFPNGHIPSHGFPWIPVAGLAGMTLAVIGFALRPSIEYPVGGSVVTVDNPLGITTSSSPIGETAFNAGWAMMSAAMVGAMVAVVRRFRRSRGIERQQFKVFVASVIFGLVGSAANIFLYQARLVAVANTIFGVVIAVMVGSIAIAVLRYRLYEFDRIISRTVSYAVVTGVLVAGFRGYRHWSPPAL